MIGTIRSQLDYTVKASQVVNTESGKISMTSIFLELEYLIK